MGTSNGKILLYSLATANVEAQLEGGHKSSSVTGLSWFPGTSLYSCGGNTIAEWNISSKKLSRWGHFGVCIEALIWAHETGLLIITFCCSSWKTGEEKLSCVLVSPDGKWVLSASQSIKLWDSKSREMKRVFTGHASPVLTLSFVPKSTASGDYYFLSTAKGDRYINVWYSFCFIKIFE